MVSVRIVPARGGRSCEHFGGYKTINRIPLLQTFIWEVSLSVNVSSSHYRDRVLEYSSCYPTQWQ